MAASPLSVWQGPAPSSETAIYTVPSGKTLVLLGIVCANTSGAAATARVSLIPDGATPDAANQIIPDVTVGAHDRVTDTVPHVLPAGGKIAVQGSSSAVTVTISGATL